MKNVLKNEGFEQVCIICGLLVEDPKEFEEQVFERFNTRVQYLETITTKPDVDDPINTGGRKDVFFAVHNEDVVKFAVPRLKLGIRWVEDALSELNNYSKNPIYPERVFEYKTWNADSNKDSDV